MPDLDPEEVTRFMQRIQYITVNKDGSSMYKGALIARSDYKIKNIKDIQGKKIAFVDPASASGYLLPLYKLKLNNILPAEQIFAGRHDSVVTMVYQKQVDVGAVFYSPPEEGQPKDSRRLVLTQFPDVNEKIQIIDFTVSVANDALVFRKELPESIKKTLLMAFDKWAQSEESKLTLKELSNAFGICRVKASEYDESRQILNNGK